MNLKHLNTFLILSNEKSFTKTAARLGQSQSGITMQIRALEESLGVRLFERIGKSVALTFEGERLLPYAKKMLALSKEIDTLYVNSGKLTIGATEAIASYLLMDILKEYTAIHPETKISLKILNGRDYCHMLENGEIDLAIVLDLPIKNKSLQVLQKRKETILLVSASMHTLSGHTHILPDDFKEHALLLPSQTCIYRQLLEQKLHAEGIPLNIALESDSLFVIKESSLCGIGLGLLPEFAVKKELIYHMLEKVNFPLDYKMHTQILIHQDKWISPDLNAFIEVAKRNLSSF